MRKLAESPDQVNQMIDQKKTQFTEMLNLGLQQIQNMLQNETLSQAEKQSRISLIVQNLTRDIGSELDKVKQTVSSIPVVESSAIDDKSASKKNKKKTRHLSSRDKKDNPKLPKFWRKNYDYGQSPYMHMDKIEKITDKPPFKKKRKTKK